MQMFDIGEVKHTDTQTAAITAPPQSTHKYIHSPLLHYACKKLKLTLIRAKRRG